MARTVEQIVQEALGAQMITICTLQAQLDEANAKIAALTPPTPPDPKAEG